MVYYVDTDNKVHWVKDEQSMSNWGFSDSQVKQIPADVMVLLHIGGSWPEKP